MDRNTLLAVILSTIVLAVGFYVQNLFFSPDPLLTEEVQVQQPEMEEPLSEDQSTDIEAEELGSPVPVPGNEDGSSVDFQGRNFALPPGQEDAPVREIVYEQTDFIRVTMSTRGGAITQVELLEHLDNGEPLKFFFGSEDLNGLHMSLGGIDGDLLNPVYNYRSGDQEHSYEFYQSIVVPGQEQAPFEIIKRYTFLPDEYMFELDIEFRNSVNQIIPLNFDGRAYTLTLGPQIGPSFIELDRNGRTDFRKFSYLDGDRRRDINNLGDGERRSLDEWSSWAAVNGKYFVAVAIPGNTGADIVFGAERTGSGIQGNQLHLIRPAMQSSRVTDSYRFYLGPKSPSVLGDYENAEDNGFGFRELKLDALVESSWLGWLENILKALMNMFYRLIPNWGVSIILLTILVKLVLYPLTAKSYESTAKMKELGPKVAALKEKFPDDPQKLNQATMELYQKEKVNPLGGCLPILLQFPFFIAMFSLFNNNFELRGATFIPGWIDDLSSPEALFTFGQGLNLWILQIDALRLLPILFLGTQLLTTKLTQPADASQNNAQMKMMTLGMPIIFFFIMYNMPSGLLVYWIFQNVISTGQQLAYNYFTHKKAVQGSQQQGKKR